MTLFIYFPQFFLILFILLQLIYNSFIAHSLKHNYPIIDEEVFFQTIFVLFILLLLFLNHKIEGISTYYNFVFDKSTLFLQLFITLVALSCLPSIFKGFRIQRLNFFEFFPLFLSSLLSMYFIMGAYSLLAIFVCLELQSLCFYIFASYNKNSCFSTEAGLKYFIISAFFSGIFLCGTTITYFCLGTVNLNEICLLASFNFSLYNESFALLLNTGIFLTSVWFFFKLACAPFHGWAPDVYEGSPLSTTIVFSILPKTSIIYFFIKWIYAINTILINFEGLFIIFGIFSSLFGTFFSLYQKRLKRMIIYSSIAQIGYICCSISLGTLESFIATIVFLIIYIVTSTLIWNLIALFYSFEQKINYFKANYAKVFYLSDLNNLASHNKPMSYMMCIIFFSISGIPPLFGFFGKFIVFYNFITQQELLLAIIIIIISSISVFYYLRIIKIIFFETNNMNSIKNKNFKVTILDASVIMIVFINSILIFLLVIGIIFPEDIYLIASYIILSIAFF